MFCSFDVLWRQPTRIKTFVRNEELGFDFVGVGAAELNFGQRCASAAIVDDVADDATNVAVFLSKVEVPKFGSALSQTGVRGWKRKSVTVDKPWSGG